jgi:outer membrane protein TolC
MGIRPALGLLLALSAAPCLAANTAGLSPEMWERVKAVEPETVDLSPTPSLMAPSELSLKECVAFTFQHNAGFRQTLQQLVNARGSLWVADQRARFTASVSGEREQSPGGDPQTGLSSGVSMRYDLTTGGSIVVDSGTGTQETLADMLTQQPSLVLSYDQPLLRGAGLASSTSERIRGARASMAEQELSFFDSRQDLAERVIGDYFDVLLAQGEVDIARRAVDRAKQFYDRSYVNFTGEGVSKPGEEWVTLVSEPDMDQARLSWEQSQQQLISREQRLRDSMDTLLLDMGFTPTGTPELTTAITYEPQDYDQAELIAIALANSTDLARLAISREDALAQLRIARSEHLPDVTASVGVTDRGETSGGVSVSTGWFGGIRVEVPLWDRQRSESIRRARRALDVLDQNTTAAREQVRQDVQRQIRAAESSRARIAIGELSKALAEKNREAARVRNEYGLDDSLRVLDAEDRLVQAERSLLQEQVEYSLTVIRLRKALGEDVTQGLPD